MLNELKTYSGILGFITVLLSYGANAFYGDVKAVFVVLGLGILLILYWLLWVTKQLNKNHKLMIQTYQGSIQKLEPSSSENHPKAWEKLINWKESPLDSKPKAAIVGHISGKNCAEIILTVGFITEEYFILYAHNPNNAPVENIDLDVEIIAII